MIFLPYLKNKGINYKINYFFRWTPTHQLSRYLEWSVYKSNFPNYWQFPDQFPNHQCKSSPSISHFSAYPMFAFPQTCWSRISHFGNPFSASLPINESKAPERLAHFPTTFSFAVSQSVTTAKSQTADRLLALIDKGPPAGRID